MFFRNLDSRYNCSYNEVVGFEWDEYKRRSNLEKHGVDFIEAAKIFLNPTLEYQDERENYPEERYIAIGHCDLEYFVVVYTWRKAKRRIISAWKAGRDEKREYQKLFN